MTSGPEAAARREELSANLHHVRERIDAACAAAGRQPGDVALIVVTKFFPVSDVEALCQLGVTDIGESRDQDASGKMAALSSESRGRLQVHFVGQLQSNKVTSLMAYADTVHSIDRDKLVGALDRAAATAGRSMDALIQIDLSGDPGRGRGGVQPELLPELAIRVAEARHLTLRGLMAVAPRGVDPAQAFSRLETVARSVRADHPAATWISAGMSADLEVAVANGATHLRVGSAILGSRPLPG